MPRHQSAHKRTSKRVRRSSATKLPEPELFIAPLTGPTIVEIVEARMKEFSDRLDAIRSEMIEHQFTTPTVQLMAEENKVLGELLNCDSTAGWDGGTDGTKDVKPITLHDSHRIDLESLFGGEPINTPDDVTRLSRRLSTVTLLSPSGEACSTTIPLDYLERLESRRPIDTTLREMIERGFFDYLDGVINGVYQ
jgi:hypothetical protein